MASRIRWENGMVLGAEHLALQDVLAGQRATVQQPGLSLEASELDPEAWERGFVRWHLLAWTDMFGERFVQRAGVGPLVPSTLELPLEDSGGLALWIWPAEGLVESEQDGIPLQESAWKHGWQQPDDVVGALCVRRFRMRGRAWVLDPSFLPAVLSPCASPHWDLVLEELRQVCARECCNQGRDAGERRAYRAFLALLPALARQPVASFLAELARLCAMAGADPLPTAAWRAENPKPHVEAWMQSLRRVSSERVTGPLVLQIPRASATLHSVSLVADAWSGRRCVLQWTRALPFRGDELQAVKLSPLAQIPRLVKAAMPGIPLSPCEPPRRDGARHAWRLSIDVLHPLWSEILATGSLAVHCLAASDSDQFNILEDSRERVME